MTGVYGSSNNSADHARWLHGLPVVGQPYFRIPVFGLMAAELRDDEQAVRFQDGEIAGQGRERAGATFLFE